MVRYLILRNPGHNRVYYLESEKLALAELSLTIKRFDQKCEDIQSVMIAGISYLAFTSKSTLSAAELHWISNLSFIFALYEQIGDGDDATLKPLSLTPRRFVDPKISMLLKYSGKTNEIFTRMMINVALLASDFQIDVPIHLLDPVSGKGTTLFEATTSGYDVTGIEVDKKLVHEATIFFKKYLEQEKYKHKLSKRSMYSTPDQSDAYVQDFEYSATKETFKSKETRHHLAFIAGNAIHTRRYFKPEKFHLIVGDLPYGIAHGNVAKKKHGSRTRSPAELLEACLPQFYKTLKPGGCLVLAWNTFVWSRDAFTTLLGEQGFQVLTEEPFDQFDHRVDQSIQRDIMVARKS